MAWGFATDKACYSVGGSAFSLRQEDVMTVGIMYTFEVTVSDLESGKITIPTLNPMPEITADGTYQFTGVATYTDLVFVPADYLGESPDFCIDIVELREVPFYTIYNSNDVSVYTLSDSTGVTASGRYVQYQIDWSALAYGVYYIQFESQTLEYRTDYFNVQLTHPCTLQITWNCNENAWGFNYSDLSFTQSLRIGGKLWKPSYKAKEKEVYDYSDGSKEITYVSKTIEKRLTTEEMPEYVHNALSLALDSDGFFIDGIEHVFEDEEYTPVWRNMSNLAPVEVVIEEAQNLRNVNCG